MLNPGIINEHINRPKAFFGGSNHLCDFIGLTHVSTVIIDLYSISLNLGDRCILLAKPIHHHIGALGGHGLSHRQSDTAR